MDRESIANYNRQILREYTDRINPPDDYYEHHEEEYENCIMCGEEVQEKATFYGVLCEDCKKDITDMIKKTAADYETDVWTVGHITGVMIEEFINRGIETARDINDILSIIYEW